MNQALKPAQFSVNVLDSEGNILDSFDSGGSSADEATSAKQDEAIAQLKHIQGKNSDNGSNIDDTATSVASKAIAGAEGLRQVALLTNKSDTNNLKVSLGRAASQSQWNLIVPPLNMAILSREIYKDLVALEINAIAATGSCDYTYIESLEVSS